MPFTRLYTCSIRLPQLLQMSPVRILTERARIGSEIAIPLLTCDLQHITHILQRPKSAAYR